jgi:hypothetical protein
LAIFLKYETKPRYLKGQAEFYLLALPRVSRYFPPAVAKVYIVSFRTHDDAQAQEMKEGALRIL